MRDIVFGKKSAEEARHYYAQEFADYRRKQPTPYVERLHFRIRLIPKRGCYPTRT